MNFFPHHISTPSRPPNIDFPKIVDFTNKEISWKWCSNSEMIEKTWLLQESITNPTTSFEVFVNKKLTFNWMFINDVGLQFWEKNWLTTNNDNQIDWERCWKKNKKQQMVCPLSSSKSLLLRAPGFISEKIIDWHQTIMTKLIWKDVEWRTKTANTVPTVFEQKFAFESFGLHFWENNCLTSNNNDQIDLKRCWVKNENSKYCSHCLRTKVRF